MINYDEEYLAFTLSHEIAHIIQGHSSEPFGISQILFMFAGTLKLDYFLIYLKLEL